MGKQQRAAIQGMRIKALCFISILAFAACTKERPAIFPDSQQSSIVDKAEVLNAEMLITTQSVQTPNVPLKVAALAQQEVPAVGLSDISGNAKFQPMFQGLSLHAQPGHQYRVRFLVDEAYITAVLVVSQQELSALSLLQQQLAFGNPNNASESLVPIFKYEIRSEGAAVRVKNELGQETSTLRIEPTDPQSATSLEVTLIPSKRKDVQTTQEDSETIFVKSKIQNKIMTKSELNTSLNLKISGDENALFYTDIGERLNVYQITSVDKLSATQKTALENSDKSPDYAKNDIKHCAVDQKASAKTANNIAENDCVVVLRFTGDVDFVSAKLRGVNPNEVGAKTPEIAWTNVHSGDTDSASFVRIRKEQVLKDVLPDMQFLDTSRMIPVAAAKNAEFLYMRTLTNNTNFFSETFAGIKSKLEIVRFDFTKNRVNVKRADALISNRGADSLDNNELLMSLGVRYLKKKDVNSQGKALSVPEYTEVDSDSEGAIAYVDWTDNKLFNAYGTPIEGFQPCLDGGAIDLKIAAPSSTIDNNTNKLKALGFNYSSTYQMKIRYDYDCGQFISFNRGTGQGQIATTATFEERVSFQRYDNPGDEKPLFTMPMGAQMQLGFGVFTETRKIPDHYGSIVNADTEQSMASIFDLRQGQKITYVLDGLDGEQEEYKAATIEVARKVVAEWNLAFRRAFKGTKLERADDVVQILVAGIDDIETRKFGDIDRNYIWYVPKVLNAGILGLGGNSTNPRSGKVENASVEIFGGNLIQYMQSTREATVRMRQYRERLAVSDKIDAAKDAQPMGASMFTAGAIAASKGTMPLTESAFQAIKKNEKSLYSMLKGQNAIGDADEVDLVSSLSNALADDVGDNNKFSRITGKNEISRLRVQQPTANAVKATDLEDMRKRMFGLDSSGAEKLQKILSVRDQFNANLDAARAKHAPEELHKYGSQCVLKVNEAAAAQLAKGNFDIEKMTDIELFKVMIHFTLVHELGHNFGLTHNFMGTFDKNNWYFDHKATKQKDGSLLGQGVNDKSGRTSSSVMDYPRVETQVTLDGPGPYDVAAIRAAYTGLLELDAGAVSTLKGKIDLTDGSNIPLVSGKYINAEDYAKYILRISSWSELSDKMVNTAGIPLRKYDYCYDWESGSTPGCSAYDIGTTYTEIVNNYVDDFHAEYERKNLRQNKANFDIDNINYHIGGVYNSMFGIRIFLDQFFLDLIEGKATQDGFMAAATGMRFFQEIIRMPDSPMGDINADANARFLLMQDGKQRPFYVEQRPLYSSFKDERSFQINTIGVDYDKAIAMTMLMGRGLIRLPHSLLSDANLNFNYVDLEEFIKLQNNAKNQYNSNLALLDEVIQDNITPIARTKSKTISVRGLFRTEASSLMRYMAAEAAMLHLDNQGIGGINGNPSELFRILRGPTVPAGVSSIKLDGLKYWALPQDNASQEEASPASALIDKAAGTEQLLVMEQDFTEKFYTNYYAPSVKLAATPVPATPAPAAPVEAVAAAAETELAAPTPTPAPVETEYDKLKAQVKAGEDAFNQLLSTLPASIVQPAGLETPHSAAELKAELVQFLKEKDGLVKTAMNYGKLTDAEKSNFNINLTFTANRWQSYAKSDPLLGMILAAFPITKPTTQEESLNAQILSQIRGSYILENQVAVAKQSAFIMSTYFRLIHPDFFPGAR